MLEHYPETLKILHDTRTGLEGLFAVVLAGLTDLKSQEQYSSLYHMVVEINL
jgi:cobalamin synthase